MLKGKRCQNKDCGVLFVPCPQVPKQKYCSKKECQQVRKREWNKQKLVSDSDYREARKDAQQKWKNKRPTYYKEYRAHHPEYTKKNREQQRVRNRKRRQDQPIAKTDESIPIKHLSTGRYRIIPIRDNMIAKTDECIVEIVAVSSR